jgi:hypothetical protein
MCARAAVIDGFGGVDTLVKNVDIFVSKPLVDISEAYFNAVAAGISRPSFVLRNAQCLELSGETRT